MFGLAPAVSAEVIQISAAGLVRHCPCDFDPADGALVSQGVLQPQDAGARYFAPVVFPASGVNVCEVAMVYRDVNDADTMTASLNRKSFAVGGDAFVPPVAMATLKSGPGVVDTVRRAAKTKIKRAKINTSKYFYFLEVEVPTINLEILGFQIVTGKTC
ncbi:hypothetical protein [Microbaculum marinum]|uniref:Uncharacterized protein n=1 Tax=Microbaculum marinum TaxID=1764581 RepID=A0AAW9REQ4_9HYPH